MAEESERSALIAEGLHPDEVMTRRKRLRQFEREKEYDVFHFICHWSFFNFLIHLRPTSETASECPPISQVAPLITHDTKIWFELMCVKI